MKMNLLHTLLCLIVIRLISGEDEINITLYNNTKTWKDALKFCANNDGFLESNVTEIVKRLSNTKIDVWTGQYKTRSPWLVTWGCYKVRSGWISLQDGEEECQNVCNDIEYYSFYQNHTCVCINGTDLLSKVYEYFPCNCCNCFQVKKKIKVTEIQMPDDQTTKCLTARCAENGFILAPETCDKFLTATCDNGLNFMETNQREAVHTCATQRSFLKWFSNITCSSVPNMYNQPHWTSAKSDYITLHNEVTEKVKFHREPTLFPECKESRKNNEDVETHNGEIEAAAVSSTCIFVVIVVILITILVYIKRSNVNNRCVKKSTNPNVTRETSQEIQHNRQSSPYSVIDDEQFSTILNQSQVCLVNDDTASSNIDTNREIRNVTQNTTSSKLQLCNPVDCIYLEQSGEPLQNDTAPYVNNKNNDYDDCVSSTRRQEKNGIGIMLTSSDYCLAKLPQNDADHYVTNTDYDHSNRVITLVDNETCKVYDHVSIPVDSDPTYDHSNMLSPKPLNYNYDHLKI